MAVTHMHVDPDIGGVGGDGSLGDPYGDLEFGISDFTFGSAGNQINLIAGTDQVLQTSELGAQITAAGVTPTAGNPLIFRGMTAAVNDGGIGGIDGDASYSILNDNTMDWLIFRDLHLHNVGARKLLNLDNYCTIQHCEIDGSTSDVLVRTDGYGFIESCYIHGFSGNGVYLNASSKMTLCHVVGDAGCNYCTYCYSGTEAVFNIIETPANDNAYGLYSINAGRIMRNVVRSRGAGSGSGVFQSQTTNGAVIRNNIIEGFSGVGGKAMQLKGLIYANNGNYLYDNTTDIDATGIDANFYDDNETGMLVSALVDPDNGNFSLVDTGNVLEGATPQIIGGGFV